MFHRKQVKLLLVQLVALLAIWPCLHQCLIITSVIAGDKKFKTISFDSKFIKPLMFESELPTTEFRRHRTMRPPKFDIDVNIPIKLPLEDTYAQPEYKKPVVSDIAFETGEIIDKNYPNYNYKPKKPQWPTSKLQFKESLHSAASHQASPQVIKAMRQTPAGVLAPQRRMETTPGGPAPQLGQQQPVEQRAMRLEDQPAAGNTNTGDQLRRNSYPYANKEYANYQQPPEFVPGGFVNLQLSGPTGGPKMTYEDFDREKWAQQLSQTLGAMPYPILNYHQLQNFYGGLGTFTNGLAENRYTYVGPLEKLKKMFAFMG